VGRYLTAQVLFLGNIHTVAPLLQVINLYEATYSGSFGQDTGYTDRSLSPFSSVLPSRCVDSAALRPAPRTRNVANENVKK
jgi:hypothetical protein